MNQTKRHFPGWMVETAYKYAKLSAMAWRDGDLGLQSEVNAALAIEILLKSLLVKPADNNKLGTLATNFKLPKLGDCNLKKIDRHNLNHLYLCVPDEFKKKLRLDYYKDVFEEKASVFSKKRYDYEADSGGGTFDDTLLHTVGDLIPQFVDYFLAQGSNDPWLQYYKNNPQLYKLPMGIQAS